jgi:branched-chain amino acid transport system ATP-binding protein
MTTLALEVKDLSVAYGGVRAVRRISLELRPGELVALIGSNGAGKTSCLGAIMGLVPAQVGSISFLGEDLRQQATHQRVRKGLTLVPEGRGILTRMTVRENLQIGRVAVPDGAAASVAWDVDRMLEQFPRLAERATQVAGTLSGGEQQMLALARALMSRPKVLLLDEPSMGLSPKMVDAIFEVIKKVSKEGMTMLLVEQNAALALEVADRGYVMESGVITLHGQARDLVSDERVRQSYLGE